MREAVAANDAARVQRVIELLSQEFAYSVHGNARSGGLIGLAAVAIALGVVGQSCEIPTHSLWTDSLTRQLCEARRIIVPPQSYPARARVSQRPGESRALLRMRVHVQRVQSGTRSCTRLL